MPSIGNTLLPITPGEYATNSAVGLHRAVKKALTFSDQRLGPVRAAMGYFSLCPQCSQNTSSGVTTSKQLLQRVNGTAGAAGVAAGACTTAAGVAATGVATTGAGVGTATGAAGTTGAATTGAGATGSGATTGAAAAATPDATTTAPAAATAPPAADTDEDTGIDAGAEVGTGADAAGRLAKISAGVVAEAAADVPVTGAEPATGAGAATGAWPSVWVAWRTLSAASRAISCCASSLISSLFIKRVSSSWK